MRLILLLFCFSVFGGIFSFAQLDSLDISEKPVVEEEADLLEDSLVVYSRAFVNDSSQNKRFIACERFIKTLVRRLKEPNSFQYKFPKLTAISIQYPKDSSFRIFSWQLYVDKDHYQYYGAIQMNSPQLELHPLVDRSEKVMDIKNATLFPYNWYGALYYKIHTFQTHSGPKYLLFGYDGYRFFSKRKVIEVLHFENQRPVFGLPIFENEAQDSTNLNQRFLLEYSAAAKVTLNYDEDLEKVVFDHVIEYPSPYGGQKNMFIPDGDIDALNWNGTRWVYEARIFNQVSEEAPRPTPILDDRQKDIIGKGE